MTVNPIPGSRTLLTVEKDEGNGHITGVLCDVEGKPLSKDLQLTHARECFTDSFSGKRILKISHEEKENAAKNNIEFFQSVGEPGGWFGWAPDFTVNGVHGEKSKKGGSSEKTPKAA